MEKVPVIIPARAGSKGIKGKNIINFCGRPLIAWSILQARQSKNISNIYVSTDGEEIADIARKYGAVVIKRPSELASDTASSEDALLHAVNEITKTEVFHTLVFLQATSPIRRAFDIDAAVEKFVKEGLDSLFSMTILDDYCLWKRGKNGLESFTYDYKSRGRRQEREPLYLENGSLYVFSKELFIKEKNRLGGNIGMYEMPIECSYEIDTEQDLKICEQIMEAMKLSAVKNTHTKYEED